MLMYELTIFLKLNFNVKNVIVICDMNKGAACFLSDPMIASSSSLSFIFCYLDFQHSRNS